MSDKESPDVVQRVHEAHEAIRSLNHLISWSSVPPPLGHQILGNFKEVGLLLPQTFTLLAAALGKSQHDYDLYEVNGGDPRQSVAAASDHLARAARLAVQLGHELEEAQSAIAGQGYKKTGG